MQRRLFLALAALLFACKPATAAGDERLTCLPGTVPFHPSPLPAGWDASLCVQDLGDRVVTHGPFLVRILDERHNFTTIIHGHRRGGRTWGELKTYNDQGGLEYEASLDSDAPENTFVLYYTGGKKVLESGACRGTELTKFAMYTRAGARHPDEEEARKRYQGACEEVEVMMSALRGFP